MSGTCLDELQNSMTKVLKEMEGSGRVQQTHMAEAYENMVKLFSGLTEIARQAHSQPTATVPSILQQLGAVPVVRIMEPDSTSHPPGTGMPTAVASQSTMTKNEGGGAPKGGA